MAATEKEFLADINTHQGIIRKLVGLYARNEADKEDLYQEILMQAWRAYPKFRGDSKFSTWLYRVSLNTILTAQRKPDRLDLKEELPDAMVTAQPMSVTNEKTNALRMAIRQLAETDRAIISLHLDGYGNNEISDMIGISLNHVAVKLHRIKNQLTKMLQPK